MTTSPSKAAAKALAAHLVTRTGLPSTAVLPYWPPPTMALPRPVAVSIHTAGEVGHDEELGAPELVSMTTIDATTSTARYRLGSWKIPLAVEVWAKTAPERDAYVQLVHAALNEAPAVSGVAVVGVMAGVTLTLADYFSLPCTFDAEGYADNDTPDATTREEWRATFQVTARCDEIVEKVVVRQHTTTVTVDASPTTAT